MTTKYTVEQIMKWKPCYELELVEELVGNGLDADGLARLGIPIKDRIWVLVRMLYDICGKDAIVDFAGNCALRAYYAAADTAAAADAATYAIYAAAAAYAAYAATYADAAYAAYAYAAYADAADAAAAYAADATYAAYAYAAYAADAAYNERQWQIDYLVEAINN